MKVNVGGISGFLHSVNEVFTLLAYYTVLIGSWLSTFWNSILDPFLDCL